MYWRMAGGMFRILELRITNYDFCISEVEMLIAEFFTWEDGR